MLTNDIVVHNAQNFNIL